MIHRILSKLVSHRHFFSYFSFSVATSALGFVSTLVLMSYIAPDEFGRIALFVSIQFLVAPIISFSAESLIAIKKTKLSTDAYEYFRRSYVTLSYLIFGFAQIGFVIIYLLGERMGGFDALFMLVPLAALLKYLIGITSIEYVMEEKSVQYGLLQFLSTALALVLTVGFIILFSPIADWRILALIIADGFFLFIRYWGKMSLLVNLAIDRQCYMKIIQFGFPLLLAVAPAWVLNEADKVIVTKNADFESVGLYAAASAIGGFMATFNASLLNATIPKLYADLSSQLQSTMMVTKRFLGRYVLVSVVFSGCFALCYWLLSEMIIPGKYAAARNIVYWVVLFGLARSVYAILGAATDYLGMSHEKLKGVVLGAIVAFICMLFGISKFGIVGVAVGVGVGYSVLSASLWLSLVERSKVELTP